MKKEEEEGPLKRQKDRAIIIDTEVKMDLRLELEFESIDDDKQDVMDVEEIKRKETGIKKPYLAKRDQTFTTAHIKAGRKIMQGLKRLVAKKH